MRRLLSIISAILIWVLGITFSVIRFVAELGLVENTPMLGGARPYMENTAIGNLFLTLVIVFALGLIVFLIGTTKNKNE